MLGTEGFWVDMGRGWTTEFRLEEGDKFGGSGQTNCRDCDGKTGVTLEYRDCSGGALGKTEASKELGAGKLGRHGTGVSSSSGKAG